MPLAKLSTSKTLVGRPVASRVSRFSCRGPNSVSPAILKVCLFLLFFVVSSNILMLKLIVFGTLLDNNAARHSSTGC